MDEPGQILLSDLQEQLRHIRSNIDAAVSRVLDHGQFIMGPEVLELEEQLKAFTGARHAITCANGTDALTMSLMATGIGAGDAVICPAFTFTATPEAIAITGATPVFTDVEEASFNIDPEGIRDAAGAARRHGLVPKALIAVDLFGQPADYNAVNEAAAAEGLWVLSDGAQSFGATYEGARVGMLAPATTTSFFPAKPLGCYGDGGAIFTDDGDLADVLRSIRVHGKGSDKYDNIRIGLNSRLDTIQAAVLIEKLVEFSRELVSRNKVANFYRSAIDIPGVAHPIVDNRSSSAWAQYTIRVPGAHRDNLRRLLSDAGIPTAIYYPKPLHRQEAYAGYPAGKRGLRVAELLCAEVISLPIHPYLRSEDLEHIAHSINNAARNLFS